MDKMNIDWLKSLDVENQMKIGRLSYRLIRILPEIDNMNKEELEHVIFLSRMLTQYEKDLGHPKYN